MLRFHAVFIVLLVGTETFFTWLSIRNVRHGAAAVERERDWLVEQFGVSSPSDIADYQRARTGLSLLRSWVSVGALLLVLYGGILTDFVTALEATGLGFVARGTLFFLGATVAIRVVGIPFDAVDTFVVEELFDFNQQSPTLWIRDRLVSLALAVVFTGVLSAAVVAFVQWLPTLWWIAAWVLFVAFSLAMLVVYPRVIAPLFNDFEPVEHGDLREAVDDVFDRAGFTCEQVYEMDAGKRSSHSNAYFVGFGRTKRVVLFDTLVEQMDLAEVQGVLAHELAHWKRGHIWTQLGASALHTGVTLGVLYLLTATDWLYAMFSLPTSATYAGLALAGLWVLPVNRLTSPLENRLSLKHEREADAFAVEVMGDGQPMIDALYRLVGENLSNPFPDPLYATFHYAHPPIPERIRHIEERTATAGASDADGATAD